ncbi:MAG: hypothetical protein RBS99_05165 [Rhodospirillales bacterium]|jgi:hypothetical protein|nr:hypothetical protein [Rhodospirillales bacterium]
MHQFIHIDTFGLSRQSTKKGAKSKRRTTARWTVDEIIAELTRKEGACDHVENPQPPVIVFGKDPEIVAAEIKRDVAAAKDPRGRKLRADAQVLLSGVASWPVRREDIDETGFQEYAVWEKLTVNALKERWGDRLQYCVRHCDEEFLHVHYGVSPELDPLTGRYSIEDLHPGMAARARARAEAIARGETPKRGKLEAAMRNGLREFQEDFYHRVSVRFGHSKDGPKRKRLTRAEWKAQQAIAQKTATMVAERDALKVRLEKISAESVNRERYEEAVRIARELQDLVEQERKRRDETERRNEYQRRQLAAEKERADRAEAEVSRLSQIIGRMKSWLKQAQSIIGRLIGGSEKLPSVCPQWLPEDVWEGVEETAKERWVEAEVEDYMSGVEIRQSSGFGKPRPAPVRRLKRP